MAGALACAHLYRKGWLPSCIYSKPALALADWPFIGGRFLRSPLDGTLPGMDDPTPTVDAPDKPPHRFRRTRIAVSVFFGVLTAALVMLCVQAARRSAGVTNPSPGPAVEQHKRATIQSKSEAIR